MSSTMHLLRRIGTEPQSAPAQLQQTPTFPQQTPVLAQYAARTRDPNAPENKYQVNQKCIYERRLPGGSYITAHLQRLQSGYYDTPIIHEDLIDNVRFVAINFVFHPSRSMYRFKSAEIRVALHNIWTDNSNPLKNAANIITGKLPDDRRHSHATQTSGEDVNGHVVKYGDKLTPTKATRPKFLRFAPHLLYGAISPETLDWNFNVAGSVGISQSGASASINPSGGMKGSYKIYEMMKIQGSVRTLRSWYNHQYDIEDGEIVWTLEENPLQKSGLPREFTFVMLLTKGSSNLDQENNGELTLDIQIDPKVAGFLGSASFPGFINDLGRFQPYRYPPVKLDLEIGQIFEPSEKGRGFNFARLSSQFDDYVFLPGTTHSKSDDFMATPRALVSGQNQSPTQGNQSSQANTGNPQQSSQQGSGQRALPNTDPNTLNLRVFLENGRGSPAPLGAPISYLHLRQPSRNPSPLPPASISGSQRSHKRTITITSRKPSESKSRNVSDSSTTDRPRSYYEGGQVQSRYEQPQRRQQSLRKTRSRSELNSEYNSSPVQERSSLSHDFRTSPVPEQVEPIQDLKNSPLPEQRESKQGLRTSILPVEGRTVHDSVTTGRDFSPPGPINETSTQYRAAIGTEEGLPDSQTLPQHEFPHRQALYETPAALQAELDQEGPIFEAPQVQSGTEGTNEWQTPPETRAELQPSPRLKERGSRTRSRPTSNLYPDQPTNLRTTEWESVDRSLENLRSTEWESCDNHSAISELHGRQPITYHSHASQADTTAEEDASHEQSGTNVRDMNRHTLRPPNLSNAPSGTSPSRPFSYSPVRQALNLAMAEHESGLAPGSTTSHGFGGVTAIARKPVGSQPTSATTATSMVYPTNATPRATSGAGTGADTGSGIGKTRTYPINAPPDTNASVPMTPPLNIHKRDISTSSSMGEATGVWNDSPPDWTSPAIAQSRGSMDGSRLYSGRIGAVAGAINNNNTKLTSSITSSPAGSVRRKMGRTVRYSYPTAMGGSDAGEGRYPRESSDETRVGERGEALKYGDEEQGERGYAEGAV